MTVRVFVGRALFEQNCQRSERMDELGHVLSLMLGYWESSLVGPVYDSDCQVFHQLNRKCMWERQPAKYKHL